jgi:hypothetical protein
MSKPPSRLSPDPWPNMLATPQGCAEYCRELLCMHERIKEEHPGEAGRADLHRLAMDVLQSALDFGYSPPKEVIDLFRILLKVDGPRRKRGRVRPEHAWAYHQSIRLTPSQASLLGSHH